MSLIIRNMTSPKPAAHAWPGDTQLQYTYHPNGRKDTPYYIEVFPTNPSTMITGRGQNLMEAETAAWNRYIKTIGCNNHEWEKRGYRNGAGFCIHCNLFQSKVFEPSENCHLCNIPTFYTHYLHFYCETHADQGQILDLEELQQLPETPENVMKIKRILSIIEMHEEDN
jgi:hypothetical protein